MQDGGGASLDRGRRRIGRKREAGVQRGKPQISRGEHVRGGRLREFKKTLLKTPLFEFGIFRSEAAFAGETRTSIALSHLVAFPRHASNITQAGRPTEVATPVGAVFYNRGCEYVATTIGSTLEVTSFLRVDAGVLRDSIGSFDRKVFDRPETPFAFSGGPIPDDVYVRRVGIEGRAGASLLDSIEADEEMLRLVHDVVSSAYRARSIRQREKNGKADCEYARWTQQLIAGDFRSSATLTDIAGRIGVSPFHLHRVFKRVVGMTIHEFRDRMRLRSAAGEMLDSRMPLSVIGLRAGYSSQSHFTDSFRKRFGMPPARWRSLVHAGRVSPNS